VPTSSFQVNDVGLQLDHEEHLPSGMQARMSMTAGRST